MFLYQCFVPDIFIEINVLVKMVGDFVESLSFSYFLRKYLGECKEGDLSVLENHLKRLNDKQMGLHADCLSFLWNFSETWHDRRLLIKEGGLPYVVKALLSNPDQYLVFSEEYWQVARINETAVGCLVQ